LTACSDTATLGLELERETLGRSFEANARIVIGHVPRIKSHRGASWWNAPDDGTGRSGKKVGDTRKIDAGVLKMESVREGDTHRLVLLGEFDIAGAEAYREEIKRIEAADPARILIDMSSLEFMDSTGLRMLIETDIRSREDSGRVRYTRPKGEVARLLELTRVDEKLDFVD
jgi:anti-sigma B factor antagonist